MKKLATILGLLAVAVLFTTGCGTIRHEQQVTTDPVTGISTTNTVTVVDTDKLNAEVAVAEIVELPLLTVLVQNNPEIRPTLVEIYVAIKAWNSNGGVEASVSDKIDELVGAKDPVVKAQVQPLIAASKALQVRLRSKFGDKAWAQIARAVLLKDERLLAAVLAVTE